MPYLILVIAIVVGLALIWRGMSGGDPKVILKTLKWTAIVVGVAIATYLTVTGRVGLAAATVAFLLPVVLRARNLMQMARNFRGPSAGQSSDVETAYLRMSLDHDTGSLNGTVLQGPFRGRHLDEMSLAELLALLRDCRVNDEQSAQLVESFLDRAHGAEWRAGEAGDGAGAGAAQGGGHSMTVEEAYEILGVDENADADEIRDAHRKLMLKNHPDQGGSTYLAAKINQAKELLLGS